MGGAQPEFLPFDEALAFARSASRAVCFKPNGADSILSAHLHVRTMGVASYVRVDGLKGSRKMPALKLLPPFAKIAICGQIPATGELG